ncbi:MAG: starch-binding protein [Prevotella sp.]|nr:starch-binding protein [Prevotella sp.]
MRKLLLLTLVFVASLTAMAQTNLTSGKTVVPLGGLNEGISLENLQLITVDNNTTNVFLLPEPSTAGTPIQGFYIDLGSAKSIGAIQSTWEGADCGANIYVTNTEPAADGTLTGETKIGEFTNAQEAQKNIAVSVENSGRYIVFVPTEPTNAGWGVKIRTFVALEKEASVLTSLEVSPSVVQVGEPTEMTFTPKDQLGLTLTGVTYTATNATLSGTTLTATAVGDVKITATLGGVSISKTISAINVSAPTANPTEPTDLAANVIAVYSAKYGKGLVDNNPGWGVGGGAPNPLYSSLEEVEIAAGHKVVHVNGTGFNNRTAGGVGITSDYNKIHVAVYPYTATEAKLFGDNAYGSAVSVTGLVPGQWNYIELDNSSNYPNYILIELVGETEFYLDHFYFAKPAVDDSEAPVLNTAELVSTGIGSATLRLKATDDKVAQVTYVITDQDSKTYTTKGDNGTEITYVVGGLQPATAYTFTVIAKDDNENASASKTVNATTAALTAAPVPTKAAADVMSIYSDSYTAATAYGIGGWGQSTQVSTVNVGGNEMLKLDNFNYLGFEYTPSIDLKSMEYLHIDVLTMEETSVGITPILEPGGGATGTENSQEITGIVTNEWKSVDIPLTQFTGMNFTTALSHQLKLDRGNGATIYVDNIYFWKEATTPTEKTVYLEPSMWDASDATEAYAAYVWDGDGDEWIAMTPVEDTPYYTAAIPANYTGLIFVRGEAGTEINWDNKWNQTVDIDFTAVANNTLFTIASWSDGEGGNSTYTTSTYVAPSTFTATFKNSIGWENVYAYTYNAETLGTWPGTKMTLTDGVYTISFKAVAAPAKIIFNDGTLEGSVKGVNQTDDLDFVNGKEYDLSAPVSLEGTPYTANGHTIYVQANHYLATNTYEVIITSEEEMEGLGGSYWTLSTGNADLRENLVLSADKKTMTITAVSTTDPALYTPLYVLMPGEVAFSDVTFVWNNIGEVALSVVVSGDKATVTGPVNAADVATIVTNAGTAAVIDLSGATVNEAITITPTNKNAVVVVGGTGKTPNTDKVTVSNGNLVVFDTYYRTATGHAITIVDDNESQPAYDFTIDTGSADDEGVTYTRTVSAEWVTFNSPAATVIPDGVDVYKATAATSGEITFTRQDNKGVGANDPVVLHNTTGGAVEITAHGTGDLNLTANPAAAAIGESTVMQHGTFRYVEPTGEAFALQNGNLVEFTTGAKIGAFRVYFTGLEAGATARFDDGQTTGIFKIENGQLNIEDGVYDLSGRRVEHPTKGIYIVNGRKVVIK